MKKIPKIISGPFWSKEFVEFWDSDIEDIKLFKVRFSAVLKQLKKSMIEKRRVERLDRQIAEQKRQIEKANEKKQKNEKKIQIMKEKSKILSKRGSILKKIEKELEKELEEEKKKIAISELPGGGMTSDISHLIKN